MNIKLVPSNDIERLKGHDNIEWTEARVEYNVIYWYSQSEHSANYIAGIIQPSIVLSPLYTRTISIVAFIQLMWNMYKLIIMLHLYLLFINRNMNSIKLWFVWDNWIDVVINGEISCFIVLCNFAFETQIISCLRKSKDSYRFVSGEESLSDKLEDSFWQYNCIFEEDVA